MTRITLALALVLVAAIACESDSSTSTPAADLPGGKHDVPLPPIGTPDGGATEVAGDADDETVQEDVAPETIAPEAPTPANWCRVWADSLCSMLARCPWPGGALRSEADCRTETETTCSDVSFLEATVAAGRMTFDAAVAAECLAATRDLSCDDFYERVATTMLPHPAICQTAIQSVVPAGETCHVGIECAAGNRCVFGADCPGTCKAWTAPGGACDVAHPCETLVATCTAGVCTLLPATVGDACLNGACSYPLVCGTLTSTCQPAGLEGAACHAQGECLFGLVCFRATPAVEGQCLPLRQADESCFEDAHCSPDLVCAGGLCKPPPTVGEPCPELRCREAWCNTGEVTPTCAPLPNEGEPCVQFALCAGGLWCDFGTCAALKAAGADCVAHRECASNRCYGSACIADGEPPCPL